MNDVVECFDSVVYGVYDLCDDFIVNMNQILYTTDVKVLIKVNSKMSFSYAKSFVDKLYIKIIVHSKKIR